MNRRCRQPSRHGFKCGGRDRPSGRSVTGTSVIFNRFEGGFDDHFRGELHAGGLQIHFLKRRPREPAQAAVKIVRRDI